MQTGLAVPGQGPGYRQVCLAGCTYLPWPYIRASSGGDPATLPLRTGGISTGGLDATFPGSTGEDEMVVSAPDTDGDTDGSDPHCTTRRPEASPSDFHGS
ncbi:UNVERIFIED_CONTAM: hypothetical protein FKN15_013028 [Acipenser sinensis]